MARLLALALVVFSLLTSAPARSQDLAADIEALLAAYHDAGRFNGTALVAEGDEVVYAGGFGQADRTWGVAHTPEVRFRIGSITKQFTAALVLQLVEEGLVDLEAPITTYLPDYPAAQGDAVTVHQLLTHTSGIPNYTSLPHFRDEIMREPFAPDSFLTVFSGLPLEFEPGSAHRYSNSGYYLLGVIIEHVTGQPYDVALRERLLTPLGLRDTGYDHFGEVIDRMATGYVNVPGGFEHAAYLDTSTPYAAGMLYSTVGDLHTWTRALHRGAAFRDAATLERMLTPALSGYAYGVGVGARPLGGDSVRVVEHGGGINGFRTMLRYLPDQERTVVVLDNAENDAAAVAEALTLLLYGETPPTPRRAIADVVAEVIDEAGVEAALDRYRTLRADAPDAYDFGEEQLNMLGYHYLGRGDTETAIALFRLNVEQFPDAWNPYDSLGEAYAAAGDRDRAVENYRQALERNPGAQSARAALERLGAEVPDATVDVPEAVLETYVGRYQLAPEFVITVTHEDGRLFAQATGQPRFTLHASSQTRFYLTEVDAQLEFNRADDGSVTGLTLHQNGRAAPAPKVE